MTLNLVEDTWIPVLCDDGTRRVIAPWQMADPALLRPDWPRADLNIACHELLIGLVFLADPPTSPRDWTARQDPDPDRLRRRLAEFAPAFNLLGDQARFLQDAEPLAGDPNPVDMLFIDSAGAKTARDNADLMVHRGRYGQLDEPLAAMALYAFQAFAPSGGAGNRTSMRGGGPLVTLVDPQQGLWSRIWANVPCGTPGTIRDLPWMRPTRCSTKGEQVFPPEDTRYPPEAFFGMPRRLRLMEADGRICGVVQKPYGTNYAGWEHPLSPYYCPKEGGEWLPRHPRAGHFGYRNWLGVVAAEPKGTTSKRARSVHVWQQQRGGDCAVIVAGWAMDNMKPRDFVLSEQPLLTLSPEAEDAVVGLILAADVAGSVLQTALAPVLAGGESRDRERDTFFRETENAFLTHLHTVAAGGTPQKAWLGDLRKQALRQFDALALPGMESCPEQKIETLVEARKVLIFAFGGYGKMGGTLFRHLGLEAPVSKSKRNVA